MQGSGRIPNNNNNNNANRRPLGGRGGAVSDRTARSIVRTQRSNLLNDASPQQVALINQAYDTIRTNNNNQPLDVNIMNILTPLNPLQRATRLQEIALINGGATPPQAPYISQAYNAIRMNNNNQPMPVNAMNILTPLNPQERVSQLQLIALTNDTNQQQDQYINQAYNAIHRITGQPLDINTMNHFISLNPQQRAYALQYTALATDATPQEAYHIVHACNLIYTSNNDQILTIDTINNLMRSNPQPRAGGLQLVALTSGATPQEARHIAHAYNLNYTNNNHQILTVNALNDLMQLTHEDRAIRLQKECLSTNVANPEEHNNIIESCNFFYELIGRPLSINIMSNLMRLTPKRRSTALQVISLITDIESQEERHNIIQTYQNIYRVTDQPLHSDDMHFLVNHPPVNRVGYLRHWLGLYHAPVA
jgi:hypothetical protein